jgi:tetratricopeptide (TPR) repeat protein
MSFFEERSFSLENAYDALERGDVEEADRLLERLHEAHAGDPDVVFLEARMAAADGDYGDALRLVDAALEVDPEDVYFLLGKAEFLFFGEGGAEAALGYAEEGCGRLRELLGELDEDHQVVTHELAVLHTEAHCLLAEICLELDHPRGALFAAEQALNTGPDSQRAAALIFESAGLLGHWERADALIESQSEKEGTEGLVMQMRHRRHCAKEGLPVADEVQRFWDLFVGELPTRLSDWLRSNPPRIVAEPPLGLPITLAPIRLEGDAPRHGQDPFEATPREFFILAHNLVAGAKNADAWQQALGHHLINAVAGFLNLDDDEESSAVAVYL